MAGQIWFSVCTVKGHVHCVDCMYRYMAVTTASRGQYPCPQCRAKFKPIQLHSIFLDLADSPSQHPVASGSSQPACHSEGLHRQVAKALRHVNEVEEDQRFPAVQRAAKEMEDVCELMDKRRDCMLVSGSSTTHEVPRRALPYSTTCPGPPHRRRRTMAWDATVVYIAIRPAFRAFQTQERAQ